MCGRGERLALALARENINSVMEGPARARVEVDIYELQKDSQYDTTDTSKCCREQRSRLFNLSENDQVGLAVHLTTPLHLAAADIKDLSAIFAFSTKPLDDLNFKNTTTCLQLGTRKVFF